MFWHIIIAASGLIAGFLLGFWLGWRASNKLNDIFPTWNMGRR